MKEYKNIDLKTNKILAEGLGQWIITISGEDWLNILVNAEKKLIADLQIPGFRKGKVPINIAKKHIKEDEILRNAGNNAIKIAYQFGLEQKDLDIKVTNKPGVEINDLSKELCKLTFNFDLPLKIDLKQYSNLNVEKPEPTVLKEEIDQQVKLLRDRFAIYSPKEKGSLELGDVAVFDFKGTIDGQDFPGNQAKDAQLEIGSKQFIEGFEEQMIGMNVNETKVFKVTFPKDYHAESLANKEAEFSVKLKGIKVKAVSENDEELVKDINIPNVNTFKELLVFIENQLKQQKEKTLKEEFLNSVFTEILKTTEVIIPNSLIDKETERLLNDFKNQLSQQKMSIEEYQNLTKLTSEQIRKEAQKDALWQLQTYVITEEVAKVEKIDVTELEIENYFKQLSDQFNIPVEEVKKNVKDLSFITNNIKRTKTLGWLWEHNGSLSKSTQEPKVKKPTQQVKAKSSTQKSSESKTDKK